MYAQGLTFTTFAPRVTFIALLIMFLGGAGNNKGMILGAALFWAFQQATTQLASFFPPAVRVNIQAFRLVVVGVLFLVVLYYLPEGLLGRDDRAAATDGGRDVRGGGDAGGHDDGSADGRTDGGVAHGGGGTDADADADANVGREGVNDIGGDAGSDDTGGTP
jgi:hypothetical protein